MAIAVVVRIPLPPGLERLCRRYVSHAVHGVPAHVTLLHPFVPVDRLDPAVRRALVDVAVGEAPFTCRFQSVERWPADVYLSPNPDEPLVQLAAAIERRLPEFCRMAGSTALTTPSCPISRSRTPNRVT